MLHSWRNLYPGSRSSYESLLMARNILHGQVKRVKLNRPSHLPYLSDFFCTSGHTPGDPDEQVGITKGKARAKTRKETMKGNVSAATVIENSSHRDGSIYKNSCLDVCRVKNRAETQLEPMMLSDPVDCFPDRRRCCLHFVSDMMQIFSLKLAKVPNNASSIQLYGYIAARDFLDNSLNYIVNRSRDNSFTVRQGSLIEMTGPKRGITMTCAVLVEYDMRVKNGEQEEDDLQLIDGATDFSEVTTPSVPFMNRINGDYGAVDITLARVVNAVEATIDVIISEVQGGFSLSLSSFVIVGGVRQGIELFHDIIGESCVLTKRHVIAVEMDSWMHLKLKIGQKGFKNDDLERYCRFKADIHGCARRQIMLEHASILLKVTWSALPP
ncbi:uncharacterized protein LOC119320133 isoform X1 [Triticum dicoccoides]|uniref:uncharacterized protein LOC119320133 isoform X1 n=1 Tax=Triticum dicoccoides TaxID=85692 RepID=UPI001891BFC8|nr:uncharacterized protein LOC119320133 isoform X1 [Triticum dicoccoides]